MDNDFSADSTCISLYNCDNAARLVDSKGTNTLSDSSPTADTSLTVFKQGDGSTLYTASSSTYCYRTDTNLGSTFPLKSGTSNKTICVAGWIRPTSTEITNGGNLWGKTDFSGHRSWGMFLENQAGTTKAVLDLGKSDGTFSEQFTHASGFSADTWVHVTVGYRDSDKSVCIRLRDTSGNVIGSDITGTAANNLALWSQTDWVIGEFGSGATPAGTYFDGYMDEVVVFVKLLTATDSTNIAKGLYSGTGDPGVAVFDSSAMDDVIFLASATLVRITVNDAPTATDVVAIFPTGIFFVNDTATVTDGGITITYAQNTLAPNVSDTSVVTGVVGGLVSLQSRTVDVFDNTLVNTGFANISWTANTEPDLAGYKIYQGTASGVYDTVYDVGLTDTPAAPRYVVWGLTFGTQYFFVVTAYDTSNNESGPSSEVNKTPTDVLLGLVHLELGALFVFEDSTLTTDELQVMMPVRPNIAEITIPVTEGLALLRPFNATAVGDTMATVTESTTITFTTLAGLTVSKAESPTVTESFTITYKSNAAVHDDPTATESQTVRMTFRIPLTTTFDASAPVDTLTAVVVRIVLSGGINLSDSPTATDSGTAVIVQLSKILLAVSDSILLSDGPFDYSPRVGNPIGGRLTNITGTSPETVLT